MRRMGTKRAKADSQESISRNCARELLPEILFTRCRTCIPNAGQHPPPAQHGSMASTCTACADSEASCTDTSYAYFAAPSFVAFLGSRQPTAQGPRCVNTASGNRDHPRTQPAHLLARRRTSQRSSKPPAPIVPNHWTQSFHCRASRRQPLRLRRRLQSL